MCYSTGVEIICSVEQLSRDSTSNITVEAGDFRSKQHQNKAKVSSVWSTEVEVVQEVGDVLATWMVRMTGIVNVLQDSKLMTLLVRFVGDDNFD